MSLHWWVFTRSTTKDYTFLSDVEVPERWWEDYNRFNYVEDDKQTVVVLESLRNRWRLYATCLPAGRVDIHGRRIRNTLLVEGEASEAAIAAGILHATLTGELASTFKEQLTTEIVDDAFKSGTDLPTGVRDALDKALRELATDRAGALSALKVKLLYGAAGSSTNVEAIVDHALHALKSGNIAIFAQLNDTDKPAEIRTLLTKRDATYAIVLLNEGPNDLTEVSPPPPPLHAERRVTERPLGTTSKTRLLVFSLTTLAVLALVAVAIVRCGPPTHQT